MKLRIGERAMPRPNGTYLLVNEGVTKLRAPIPGTLEFGVHVRTAPGEIPRRKPFETSVAIWLGDTELACQVTKIPAQKGRADVFEAVMPVQARIERAGTLRIEIRVHETTEIAEVEVASK